MGSSSSRIFFIKRDFMCSLINKVDLKRSPLKGSLLTPWDGNHDVFHGTHSFAKNNFKTVALNLGFSGCSVVRNLHARAESARDTGLIPGLGRSPGGGHGNPFQYSCLEIPWTEEPDRQVTVHEVAQSWTWLSNLACTLAMNNLKKKLRKQINLDSIQNK